MIYIKSFDSNSPFINSFINDVYNITISININLLSHHPGLHVVLPALHPPPHHHHLRQHHQNHHRHLDPSPDLHGLLRLADDPHVHPLPLLLEPLALPDFPEHLRGLHQLGVQHPHVRFGGQLLHLRRGVQVQVEGDGLLGGVGGGEADVEGRGGEQRGGVVDARERDRGVLGGVEDLDEGVLGRGGGGFVGEVQGFGGAVDAQAERRGSGEEVERGDEREEERQEEKRERGWHSVRIVYQKRIGMCLKGKSKLLGQLI